MLAACAGVKPEPKLLYQRKLFSKSKLLDDNHMNAKSKFKLNRPASRSMS